MPPLCAAAATPLRHTGAPAERHPSPASAPGASSDFSSPTPTPATTPPRTPRRLHRPDLAAGPLRRAIRPLQALGEPHPGPPRLYALVLGAVAPWSHRTAYSGEFPAPRAASPSRAMPPIPHHLPRYPSGLRVPRTSSRAKPPPKMSQERRLGLLRARAAAEQRRSGDSAPPVSPNRLRAVRSEA